MVLALGLGGPSVVFSFLIEALLVSFVGGLLGCLAVLPLNGLTTGSMNWQTFSHLAFAFRITPELLAGGIVFALLMGIIRGLPPAIPPAPRSNAAGRPPPPAKPSVGGPPEGVYTSFSVLA